MKVLAISNSTPFFFPARCALKPLLFKNLVFLDRFFWPFLFFLAPLRVEKPCVLPLFFSIAETLQQAKGSKKMLLSVICTPPAPTWPKVAKKCTGKNSREFPPSYSSKLGLILLNPAVVSSLLPSPRLFACPAPPPPRFHPAEAPRRVQGLHQRRHQPERGRTSRKVYRTRQRKTTQSQHFEHWTTTPERKANIDRHPEGQTQ